MLTDRPICDDPFNPSGVDLALGTLERLEKPGLEIVSLSGGGTVVEFELRGAPVGLHAQVFDLSGRLERDLGTTEAQPGMHRLDWDGRNEAGQLVAAGIHFIRLTSANGLSASAKALVLRGGR